MSVERLEWPQKTRELHNHHFDSTIWNEFQFRDDDIIIATYGKSGTTWMQQIVSQLLFGGAAGLPVAEMSPWMDLRVPPKAEKLAAVAAQTHRRFLKTHLPVEALVFSPQAKYIYVGRDGRDIVWSLYNHHANANETWYQLVNDTPGRIGPPVPKPPASVRQYFLEWLDRDGYPFWSFWDNVRSWWQVRSLPNVLLVHYASLKQDLPGEMHRVADFLGITIDQTNWEIILTHCSFEYMKHHAREIVPLQGDVWQGGARTFIHQGTTGRWRDTLTPEDNQRYEHIAQTQLGTAAAHWLATGEYCA